MNPIQSPLINTLIKSFLPMNFFANFILLQRWQYRYHCTRQRLHIACIIFSCNTSIAFAFMLFVLCHHHIACRTKPKCQHWHISSICYQVVIFQFVSCSLKHDTTLATASLRCVLIEIESDACMRLKHFYKHLYTNAI